MKFCTHYSKASVRMALSAVVLLTATVLPGAECPQPKGHQGLSGHWIVTITQPSASRFVNLVTFRPEGEIEIFASYRQTQSTGRGSYCRINDHEFAVAMVQIGYNPMLVQNETATIRSTITLNEKGDGFIGSNLVEIVDPITGKVLFSGDGGSVAGRLIRPEAH